MWFEQRLDHFHPTDDRSWRQRYWVSEEFRRPGGPAILMIGGEGPENPVWMVAGTWTEYARAFGATMFLLEHRYAVINWGSWMYGVTHQVGKWVGLTLILVIPLPAGLC